MTRILVPPEVLLKVGEQFGQAAGQLESMIHTLNQNIHMLASGWEGTTRSRFYADFQKAHREMTQTTEHIQRTSLELKAIAQRFKAADERVQPIQVAGHTLGAFPMMRGPAGYGAIDDAGRKFEESWNAVQQEAGEFWEGLKIGAIQLGSSLKDTAISLYEDPLGTGKSMLYNATIGTAEDIRDTAIWAGRMLFSNEYRNKVVEDTMQEVEAAGGWSTYLGTQSAMIIGGALLNRAGLRGGGPRNNKHDDLGGGNSGGSGSGNGNGGSERRGSGNSAGNSSSGNGDGKKPGNEGTPKAMFENGRASIETFKSNPKVFSGKSAEEIAKMLEDAGYEVTVQASKKSRSGAKIIKIQNTGGDKNITQVQVSPGGGRHGDSPYVKISTNDQGIIKIVDGSENVYKTDGAETATIIFTGRE